MHFTSMTSGDGYYNFVGENGESVYIPSSSVVFVDDNSGMKTIKLTATRKAVGTINV